MSRPRESKRHRGREMAVQMLYQRELGEVGAEEVLARFDPLAVVQAEIDALGDEAEKAEGAEETAPEPPACVATLDPAVLRSAFEYASRLVKGATEQLARLDELIVEQADNWRLERMAPVDRNILRLAVYELLSEDEVPKVVVLDEAIELAKKYGSEQSGAFVNGVLDGLLKRHDFPGRMT